MKHGKLVLAVLVAGLVLLTASPALAALKASWQMNETSGPMSDSSGFGNNGTPTDVVRNGAVYAFNGSTSRVAVPDSDSLDPASKNIKLTARLKVAGASMDDDSYDIVRKGLSTTPGGDYKMEIKRSTDSTVGRLNCVFKGKSATVNVLAKPDLVDGNWHTIACAKTATSVVATVDGKNYARTKSAGSISNSSGVLVGAKTASPLDDVFAGSMDYAGIDIAQ